MRKTKSNEGMIPFDRIERCSRSSVAIPESWRSNHMLVVTPLLRKSGTGLSEPCSGQLPRQSFRNNYPVDTDAFRPFREDKAGHPWLLPAALGER
jgi:hypothetical protein